MTQNDTLVVEGYKPADKSIPLKTGWNLAGYLSSTQSQPVADALSSLGDPSNAGSQDTWDGNYTEVRAYLNNGTHVGGQNFVPTLPLMFSDLKNMSVGRGYWIYMTQNDILEYS